VEFCCGNPDGLHGGGELGEPVANQLKLALGQHWVASRPAQTLLDLGLALQELQGFVDGFRGISFGRWTDIASLCVSRSLCASLRYWREVIS
jgi:hypothetical protein